MASPHDITPPRWAVRWLHWYCPDPLLEEIEGDLLESFQKDLDAAGPGVARRRFVLDAILFCNPTTFRRARELRGRTHHRSNPLVMWMHYLKTGMRNFRRQRVSSLINVSGLSVGLAVCLMIGLFVHDELRYDQQHPFPDRLYRVYTESAGAGLSGSWATSSPAVAPTLRNAFPEVEQALRLYRIGQKMLFRSDGQSYLEEVGFYAEPAIFDLLHLPLRAGDPATALSAPNTVILSQELARKYYGEADPVGKTLTISNKETIVTGVFDKPDHFHLTFDFLISFETLMGQVSADRIESWVWQDFVSYVRLHPDTDVEAFTSKLAALIEQRAHPQTKEYGFHYYLGLQPVRDIRLHSRHFQSDVAERGNYRYTLGLSIAGLFLLAIACINFINLTTARAVRRAKEVGVRKAVGALRRELILQFISEAVFTVLIAMIVACLVTNLLLPGLNQFTGKEMSFSYFRHPSLVALFVGFTVFTGLLAGAYPAFVLSGFKPAVALTAGRFHPAGHVQWLRKALVVLQFSLSILLIISVLIIFKQVSYLNHTHLGFEKAQLLHFPMKGRMFANKEAAKDAFTKLASVEAATTCFGIPGDVIAGDNIIVPGDERRSLPARLFAVDHDYLSTMQLEVVAGRGFSRDITTDATAAFVINETAVSQLGLAETPEEALGHPLEWQMWSGSDTLKKGRVIGVVRDFHYESLHAPIQSTILHIDPSNTWKMAVRVATPDVPAAIAALEQTWDDFETGYPFDYQFVDESFGAMYAEEQKLHGLLWIFTALAIFVACIGAFGMATYSAERRRGEISIRRVLGASTASIVTLLSREFVQLVVVALIVAVPAAWYFMYGWLQGFAYRISIGWWVFALAGCAALVIAVLSVSYQSIRAARANPVNALRDG